MKLTGYQRYFISVFLIVLGFSIILGGAVAYLTYRYVFTRESDIHSHLVNSDADKIVNYLLDFERDIRFLIWIPPVQEITRVKGQLGYEDWKTRLKSTFVSLMRAKKIYMQLRYVNEAGEEIVRVDFVDGQPVVIPDEKLQNKADRYYFKETMKLAQDKVYVSPIDLNKENGQIEIPYKPTLRYAMPLFSKDGKRRGIIIANILVWKILHLSSEGKDINGLTYMFLDKDGYYLHHSSDMAKEWGGLSDLNTGLSFKKDHPLCYEKILLQHSGRFFCRKEKQYLFFQRVQPDSNAGLSWVRIVKVARKKLLLPVYISVGFVIAALFLVLALVLLISKYVAGQLEKYEIIKEEFERQKFETVIQKMGSGIIVCSPDWKITAINASAQRYLNIKKLGDISLLDFIFNNYSVSISREKFVDALQPHKIFDLVREETEQFKALYLEAGLDILKDPAGEALNIIMTLHDVTDIRKEELMKQDFLGLISHKLRTPITVLLQSLYLLEEIKLGPLSDEQKDVISDMSRSSYNLRNLINKLLGFVTINSQTIELSKESVEVRKALSDTIDPIIKGEKNKKVELDINCLIKNATVNIDLAHFRLIVGNIAENAIKFNDKDIVKISVGAAQLKNKVQISISDNGPGIPVEERDKIFEKFYQVEKYFTGNVEGAGLGLAIVKRLVTAYGGQIDVESEIGKGSKFTIRLRS